MRFSIVAAALVAVLVGFGGTLAVIVQAAGQLGATPGGVGSAFWGLVAGLLAPGLECLVRRFRTGL